MRKRRAIPGSNSSEVELNVMPFIDVFSLLCTFLLFSAVFVSIGIIEVQLPFFSNAQPEKPAVTPKPERMLELKLNLDKKTITLDTAYDRAPRNATQHKFPQNLEGRQALNAQLVKYKEAGANDKITLFVSDDVIYEELIHTLDYVKFSGLENPRAPLFPKVIMGNIIL